MTGSEIEEAFILTLVQVLINRFTMVFFSKFNMCGSWSAFVRRVLIGAFVRFKLLFFGLNFTCYLVTFIVFDVFF